MPLKSIRLYSSVHACVHLRARGYIQQAQVRALGHRQLRARRVPGHGRDLGRRARTALAGPPRQEAPTLRPFSTSQHSSRSCQHFSVVLKSVNFIVKPAPGTHVERVPLTE